MLRNSRFGVKTKDLFRLITTVVQSSNDDGIRNSNLKMCCVWKSIILEGAFMSSMTTGERCTSPVVRDQAFTHTVLCIRHS